MKTESAIEVSYLTWNDVTDPTPTFLGTPGANSGVFSCGDSVFSTARITVTKPSNT